MDYYCWQQYYDLDTHKQVNSDEIRYYHGHKHGVQPSQQDWSDCLDDLLDRVNAIRESQTPPLVPLTRAHIAQSAQQRTRSAH